MGRKLFSKGWITKEDKKSILDILYFERNKIKYLKIFREHDDLKTVRKCFEIGPF